MSGVRHRGRSTADHGHPLSADASHPRSGSESGFTLLEMMVATSIMLVVTGAIFSLMNPAQGAFQAQPEVSDMQQRMRVGVDTLTKDVVMAGAGTYSGSAVGTLSNYFAAIVPARVGTTTADPPGTVRSDAITIMYVPSTPAQTTIANPMPTPSAEIKVNKQPGCPSNDDLCGFSEGMRLLIFDETGSYDVFTVTHVQESALHLQHRDDRFSKSYDTGAYIVAVASHTYYLDSTNAQLRHYDGYQTDLPVVDNVVGFSVAYFGEPVAPRLRKPVTDPTGPWTTYGPKPPPLGVTYAGINWPAGENCVFAVSPTTGLQVPRLTDLGSATGPLVPLTSTILTDGPWCPDSAIGNRYDADLLRVRKVRVTLRLQVGLASLRGASSTLFSRPGTSRGGQRYVPDQEIRFDVTPRNLNLGR